MGRGMRALFVIAVLACTALASLGAGALAQSSDEPVTFYGPSGSITINGKPAPPGTLIFVGVGNDGMEIVANHRVQSDGSWQLSLLPNWRNIHLFVDGFRVPGGPFDYAPPGAKWKLQLDVGVETDPKPRFVYFHARREDITLFGEPLSDDAMIREWRDGESWRRGRLGEDGWDVPIPPHANNISYTINGFPVLSEPYSFDPADAPFWMTLHAGDPEGSPFQFYGPPGDVLDLSSLCFGRQVGTLKVVGMNEDGWEHTVTVLPDGSWTLYTPSGTKGIRLVVKDARLRPDWVRRYDALPSGGAHMVQLDHIDTQPYAFHGIVGAAIIDDTPSDAAIWFEARSGRTVLARAYAEPGGDYRIYVPYGALGVSFWAGGQRVADRLYNAIAGEPDPQSGYRCSKRVDLSPQAHDAPVLPPALLWQLESLLLRAEAATRIDRE